MNRQEILDELSEVIGEAIGRAKAVRYQGTSGDTHKTRTSYYNSLATLINAYARLSRDVELDEIREELEELKEDLKIKRKDYR